MKTFNSVKRRCNVLASGPVIELNGITGPVYGCRLTTEQIVRLVTNGKKVEEINPDNNSEKQLLTLATCGESVFGKKNQTPNVEVKVEKQVEKQPQTVTERTKDINNMSKKERKKLEWEERQRKAQESVKEKLISAETTTPETNVENTEVTE